MEEGMRGRALAATAFLAAAVLFALEILIPKVLLFLHVVDNLLRILPLTFLGLAAGAGVALLAPTPRMLKALFAAVPPVLLGLGALLSVTVDVTVLTVAMTVPFALLGGVLAAALSLGDRPRVYAADLLGALTGLAAGVFLLPVIGGEALWLALAALSGLAAWRLLRGRAGLFAGAAPALLACLLLTMVDKVNLLRIVPDFAVRDGAVERPDFLLAHRHLREGRAGAGRNRLLATRWSAIARVDVIESADYLFDRFFEGVPGTAPFAENAGQRSVNLYYDNTLFSVVSKRHALLEKHFLALHDAPEVLIIGVGGGDDIARAVHAGATSIVAVEINGETIDLMRGPFADVSGHIYDRAEIVHLDGRAYVETTDRAFDVITLFFADLYVPFPNSNVFLENYLYTLEAFDAYLERLKPGGMLHVGKWFGQSGNPEMLRMTATAAEALRRRGLDPEERIVFVRIDFGSQIYGSDAGYLLIKREPFTAAELARIRALAEPPFHVEAAPGVAAGEVSRLIREGAAFGAAHLMDISPTTDDRPFFYEFDRQHRLNRDLLATLLLVSVVVLVPLYALGLRRGGEGGRGAGGSRGARGAALAVAACGLLGAGYALMEASLIQRFHLFLGVPTWSLAAVLGGLLLGGALGSLLSRRLGARGVALCCVAAAAYGLALHGLAAPLLGGVRAAPPLARGALVLALLVPLGAAMSAPFPPLLSRVEAWRRGAAPLAYGLNSLCLVLAMAAGLYLALARGFGPVGVLASVAYVLAAAGGLALRGQR